jgi:hypothetical protein
LPAAVEPLFHWLPPDTETVIVTRGPFRLPRERKDKKGEQNRELAQEFSTYAAKTAPDHDDGSIWHLRMMAQPIYRYVEEAAVDGAIFAFAQGTDPEAFLILESRPDEGISQWHFGMASACVWELHAKRGDREVWSRPKWHHQDTDTVYGLVGPFAVDPKLFPPEMIK